jgi:hypothetical protein
MDQSSRARTEDGVIEEAKAGEVQAGLARIGKGVLCAGLGLALVFGVAGCHKPAQQPATSTGAVDQNGTDPADANMAQAGGGPSQPAQVLGESAQEQNQQQGEDYSQQPPAPIVRQAPDSGQQSYDNGGGQLTDQQAADLYADDLTDAQASQPPPPLPEYEQPPAPDPDYMWTPGYWAWGPMGYYWIPGYWVAAPYEGALWTPGYWSLYGGFYRFHHGYWGLHIGFYGGVDYGYGYIGHGYYGGYWNGGHFFYNTTITRVNVNVIRNVYVHTVVVNNVVVTGRTVNRVSFNGGRGGVVARPLPAEVRVLQEKRIPPMASQVQAQRAAAQNRQQLYSQNGGRPAVAVAARPIAADRVLPAALPRPTVAAAQSGVRGGTRPGIVQAPAQGARTQPQAGQPMRNAPAAPQSQARQAQPQAQVRQAQPQPQAQPQVRQAQPQPEVRPVQPQTQVRQAQPQPQPRQAQPPQARPQEQARPQPAPQPQAAPRPQPQAAPRPQPAPQPQARPAPAPRPQPAPAPRPQPKEEEKPR